MTKMKPGQRLGMAAIAGEVRVTPSIMMTWYIETHVDLESLRR
jgi:hypothetical protein